MRQQHCRRHKQAPEQLATSSCLRPSPPPPPSIDRASVHCATTVHLAPLASAHPPLINRADAVHCHRAAAVHCDRAATVHLTSPLIALLFDGVGVGVGNVGVGGGNETPTGWRRARAGDSPGVVGSSAVVRHRWSISIVGGRGMSTGCLQVGSGRERGWRSWQQ